MSHQEKAVYNSGHKCRCEGGDKCECKYDSRKLILKSFWLAGWHDADMENKS